MKAQRKVIGRSEIEREINTIMLSKSLAKVVQASGSAARLAKKEIDQTVISLAHRAARWSESSRHLARTSKVRIPGVLSRGTVL